MQLKEQKENISGKTFTVFYATLSETRNSGQLNESLKTSDKLWEFKKMWSFIKCFYSGPCDGEVHRIRNPLIKNKIPKVTVKLPVYKSW